MDALATLSLPIGITLNLLMAASASYCELMPEPTPEIIALLSYHVSDEEQLIRFLPLETAKELCGAKPAERRRLCLKIMRDLTKERSRTSLGKDAARSRNPRGIS